MSFVRRNRIVSVRVSQEEYDLLEQLAQEHGAFSVSDFVRRLVTNTGLTARVSDGGGRRVRAQIAELQREVERLSDLLGANPAIAVPHESPGPLKRPVGQASTAGASTAPGPATHGPT